MDSEHSIGNFVKLKYTISNFRVEGILNVLSSYGIESNQTCLCTVRPFAPQTFGATFLPLSYWISAPITHAV